MGILDSLKKLFGGPGQDQPADDPVYPDAAADASAPAEPAQPAEPAPDAPLGGQEQEEERLQ